MIVAAYENFRRNLRTAMESREISQRALAEIADLKHPYVNRVLQGKTVPGLEQCERLSKAIEVPLIRLLESPRKFADSLLTHGN